MEKFRLKIRAGESFLYRSGGTESQVFEIRMRRKISHDRLRRAARLAYKRYPYFNSRFRIKDSEVFLCNNDNSPMPERRRRLRRLGGAATLYNLLDITYYKSTIYISFHHAMCDGRGVMNFIKTLLYYYLHFCHPYNTITVPNVRLAGERMLRGEVADPVAEGDFEFDKERIFTVSREAFSIPQNAHPSTDGRNWRYEVTFDSEEIMTLCRKINATPAILVSMTMQRALLKLYPTADKPMLCNLTCDWRHSIGLPNTFRNCVSSIYLPYTSDLAERSDGEVATHFRDLIARQKEINSARCSASVMRMMSDMLDKAGDYGAKQALVSRFTSRPIDTFVCSYTGRADMGDAEKYIDSIHIYSSGIKGLHLQMMSVGETLTVDILQSFPEGEYVEAFIAEAKRMGIKYIHCSNTIEYTTPKDIITDSRLMKWSQRAAQWLRQKIGGKLRIEN